MIVRIAMLVLASVAGALSVAAQPEVPDSAVNHELQEVVVEGARQRASVKTTVYTPQKQVKSASLDATDLLQRMAIPELRIDPVSKSVATASGQSVSIFINYVEAEAQDLQGLRTTDVKSVQYLDYPEDPRFKGVPHAVNIIAQEYEYGGYTKLTHSEFASTGYTNKGALFSKFAYKKMVYDLYGAWDYVNDTKVGTSVYSTYRLSSATIRRNQVWDSSDFSYINVPVTLRASYNTEKMQIINSVGFSFNDRMDMDMRSRLTFSDDPDRNFSARNNSPSVSRALSWRGSYYFMFPKSWSLGLYPNISYSHNNNYNTYSTDIPDEKDIVNNARENAFYSRLDLFLNKRLNQHNTLKLSGNISYSNNEVAYSGSNAFDSNFDHMFYGVGLAYTFNIDRFSLDADAGFAREYIKTNGVKYNDSYPYIHVSGSWSPNSRNRFGLWCQLASTTPQISERTDNVIQQNELTYSAGNPLLENSRLVTLDGAYTFLPSNTFNFTAHVSYFGLYDRHVTVYEPYRDGTALLQTYRNNGDYNQVQVGLNATLRLLNSNLVIQLSPLFSHYGSTGYIDETHNPFTCSLSAQYYLKQFNFSAYYNSREYDFNNENGAYITNRSYYRLSAGWGNGSWAVGLSASCFFRQGRRAGSWSDINTPLLSMRTLTYNANYNAGVFATVTYTIGYGKHIQRDNEIGSMAGAGSAIMK